MLKRKLTGTLFNYYFNCPTQLWFHAHRISMEPFSDEVYLGKLIEKWAYSKEKEKNILKTDEMAVDLVKFGDKIIIKEIKKSSKGLEAARAQALYYAYLLKKKGINAEEIWILVPQERKRFTFEVTEEDLKWIEEIREKIKEIIQGPPPKPEKKPKCRKCSFRELCWA